MHCVVEGIISRLGNFDSWSVMFELFFFIWYMTHLA